MSSAAADAGASGAPKGKKKLIVIIAAVLVLALAGGGAMVMMKKKAAAEAAAADEDGEGEAAAPVVEKAHASSGGHKTAPTFVPLEPFVVNLADKEADRYAQIGITLEVDDAKFADDLKAYMPAIRSGILMVLAHKTSQQLLQPEGKLALAREIMRESVLPLGIEVDDDDEDDEVKHDAPRKKKKKRRASVHNPVTHVHFSNFIVQ